MQQFQPPKPDGAAAFFIIVIGFFTFIAIASIAVAAWTALFAPTG